MRRGLELALGLAAVLATAGCNSLPGRPGPISPVLQTGRVTAFGPLYARNCAACHGIDGGGGAAIALADPVYLAIANDDVLRRAIANGVSGTQMPAFAESAGGTLDGRQIDTLLEGIRQWARPSQFAGQPMPPYSADLQGNPERGARVYATFCSSCHGPGGRGGKKAGSVVDPSFLALVSNQGLRSFVIVGQPNLGAPDWRNDVPGQAMSDQEITDVVSWLESHRVPYPGEPYPQSGRTGAKRGKSE
jgi:cytochrome c oxidase cbb3-type subunit 3